MTTTDVSKALLGIGIYSVPEASRLTGVSEASIRRWLWGYRYLHEGRTRASEPLWTPAIPVIDHSKALGFRDLIEILFVARFRQRGVSLATIRRTIDRAIEVLESPYPLSSLKFKTDGRRILADVVEDPDERRYVYDLLTGQMLLENFFDRLYVGLDYSELDELQRWWPLGKDRRVVLDPHRSFGDPVVAEEGVPTSVLAKAWEAEKSVDAVSYWYGVSPEAVQDAVDYEQRLAA